MLFYRNIHKDKVESTNIYTQIRLAYQQLSYNQQLCPFWASVQTPTTSDSLHNTALYQNKIFEYTVEFQEATWRRDGTETQTDTTENIIKTNLKKYLWESAYTGCSHKT